MDVEYHAAGVLSDGSIGTSGAVVKHVVDDYVGVSVGSGLRLLGSVEAKGREQGESDCACIVCMCQLFFAHGVFP